MHEPRCVSLFWLIKDGVACKEEVHAYDDELMPPVDSIFVKVRPTLNSSIVF
jgi:hypothetical protein